MAIHTKLTVKEPSGGQPAGKTTTGKTSTGSGARRPPSEEERATRKTRVAAAKDALARSVGLRGDHVPPARSAIKVYLRQLNEAHQPSDDQFQALVEGPFRVPPKPRGERR